MFVRSGDPPSRPRNPSALCSSPAMDAERSAFEMDGLGGSSKHWNEKVFRDKSCKATKSECVQTIYSSVVVNGDLQ